MQADDAQTILVPGRLPAPSASTARARALAWITSARAIPLAIAAVTLLVFSPALLNGFVEWDDYINLFENHGYRGLGWKQIRWMFSSTLMGHYIPVTWLTFGLDYVLWGMNPFGYHLTNNLIHAANAALFYILALRVLARATSLNGVTLRLAGAVSALFFALHPLRAESVAWATERRDVLSGLFFLLTILLYLKAADAAGPARRRWIAASVTLYGLALLSKSIVMSLPLVLMVLDHYPLGRLPWRWGMWRESSARAALGEKLPYLVLAAAGAATSFYAVASNDFFTSTEKYGWPARIAMAGYSFWFYFQRTVVPVSLSPLYELPAVVHPLEARFALSGAAVIAVSAALLALRRRWPAGLAIWAYYGIILAPVSGIVHAGHQLAHDRYSYLSCLGWALLVGAGMGIIARAGATGMLRPWFIRAAAAVAAGWLLALGTLTWYQVQIWRDTDTLWRYALESDPACSVCQANLGLSLYRRKLFPLAKQQYESALALRPDRVRWHGNLGLVLQAMGDLKGAIEHIGIPLARYPNDPDLLANMAVAFLTQKRHAEAMPLLEHARQVAPEHVPSLVNLGVALAETGQPERGLPYLLRALDLKPEEPIVHLDLAKAYQDLGNPDAARRHYERLRGLDPELARSAAAEFLPAR